MRAPKLVREIFDFLCFTTEVSPQRENMDQDLLRVVKALEQVQKNEYPPQNQDNPRSSNFQPSIFRVFFSLLGP